MRGQAAVLVADQHHRVRAIAGRAGQVAQQSRPVLAGELDVARLDGRVIRADRALQRGRGGLCSVSLLWGQQWERRRPWARG